MNGHRLIETSLVIEKHSFPHCGESKSEGHLALRYFSENLCMFVCLKKVGGGVGQHPNWCRLWPYLVIRITALCRPEIKDIWKSMMQSHIVSGLSAPGNELLV